MLDDAIADDVLESIQQMVTRCDDRGNVFSVNRFWSLYTGLPTIEAAQRSWEQIVHPEDLGDCVDAWARAVERREPFSMELRLRRADSVFRWHMTRAVPVMRGAERFWIATSVDIDGSPRRSARDEAEAMPHIVWHAEADAGVVWFNRRWKELTGLANSDFLGWKWLDAVHDGDRSSVQAECERALRDLQATSMRYRLRAAAGSYRWMFARTVPLLSGEGTLLRWVGTITDIDDEVQAEIKLADAERRYRALAETLPQLVWACGPDGTPTYLNQQWFSFTGQSPEIAFADRTSWTSAVHEDDRERVAETWLRSSKTGEEYDIDYRLFHAETESYRWVIGRGVVQRGSDGEITGWVGTCTDFDAHKRAEDAGAFLNRASELLASSLDLDETLRTFVQIAVPSFSDWCAIYTRETGDELRLAAVAHEDPEKVRLIEQLIERYPVQPTEPTADAALRGKMLFLPDIGEDIIRSVAQDAEHLQLIEDLRLRSAIIQPIMGARGPIGCLQFVNGTGVRRFDKSDLETAEFLSKRLSIAMENARLFERERRVADSFQRAALPTELARVPGVALDSEYAAARDEASIGGDWYDAFAIDGKIVISVGDVAGKGLDAAVLMAHLRQTIRTIGQTTVDPNAILAAADHALKSERAESFATSIVGVYDPPSGVLRYACAGHPPPLVRRADGTIEQLEGGGTPLGLFEGAPEREVTLDLGDMFVAFTDGLIESERDIFAAEEKLRRALSDPALAVIPRPARFLRDAMLAKHSDDDVAVLTLRVGDISTWVIEGVQSLRRLRGEFIAAIHALGVPVDATAAEMIAGELAANVQRHCAGQGEFALVRIHDAIEMHLFDRGADYRPRSLPGTYAESGRGLAIIAALADTFEVRRHAALGNHAIVRLPSLAQSSATDQKQSIM